MELQARFGISVSRLVQLAPRLQNWLVGKLEKATALYGVYPGRRAWLSSFQFTGSSAVGSHALQNSKMRESTLPAAAKPPRGHILHKAAGFREQGSKPLQ